MKQFSKWLCTRPRWQKSGKYGHGTIGVENYLEFDLGIGGQICIIAPGYVKWTLRFEGTIQIAFFYVAFSLSRPYKP